VKGVLARRRAAMPAAVVEEAPRRWNDVVSIGSVRWRDYVRVRGVVSTIRVVPWATGAPVLECTVFDETGGITLVFLGREAIGGLTLGRLVEAEGRVVEAHRRLVMMNPPFDLQP
jgi:hypothetical protein